MNKYSIILIVVLSTTNIYAQEIFSWSKETGYCTPSVAGLPRPKAFIVKYELQPNYKITSTAKDGNFENSDGEINRNRRLDFRLRFPIINKPSLTIAAGLKYSREEFRLDNYPTSSEFYNNLEDRDLKSIGAHLYVIKPTKSKKYFILRAGFDFNGDYPSDKINASEFLKFSITPLIGWKKNYFYAGLELQGNSYRLDNADSVFSAYDKLHLFHSELRFTITYERELHDWLWFGIEGGVRHNLTFNVTNGPKATADVILKNKLSEAALINASIFIVPPKGFFKKSTSHY